MKAMKPNSREIPLPSRNLLSSVVLSMVVALWSAQGIAQSAHATSAIQWEDDFNRAVRIAQETHRPIFLHFYGNNCPPCKGMEASVFPDPRVVAVMNERFVPVKVDTAHNKSLAKQLNIQAIPTDIVLNGNGQVINRREGGISADRFLQYLNYLQGIHSVNKANQAPATPPPVLPSATPAVPTLPSVPVVPANEQVVSQPIPRAPESAPPLQKPSPAESSNVLIDPFTKQPAVPAASPAERKNTASVPVPATASPFPLVASQPVDPAPPVKPAEETPVAKVPAASPPPIISESLFAATPSTVPSAAPVVPTTPERSNPVRPEEKIPSPVAEETTAVVSSSKQEPGSSSARRDSVAAALTVEVPLALEGFCPVILGEEEKWIPGNPAFYAMFQGQVYRFSSEESMLRFQKDPIKYAPIAMGEDIVLMVERNKKAYGSRKYGAWYDGRVYLFSSQETLDSFSARPEFYAEIARKYETALKSSPNTVQR